MGAIRRTFKTLLLTAGGGAAYLSTSTTLTTPLPVNDELLTSRTFKRYNPHNNPTLQDVVTKRVPLAHVRPELRDNEAALATEFARGAWAGYAYAPQRIIMALTNKNPKTDNQLFDRRQLAFSKYELGTRFSDHFEVVERTKNSITVRCGGSPLEPGPREVDGLLVLSAKIDKKAGTVDLGLKTAFFNSAAPVLDERKPVPFVGELLHRYYSRAMVDSGALRLTR
ncbi:hypothetical protein M426DRAFT_324389 [Hypoxylon sp. CI-4A]|nr:hypothetical protein M426DRAFT_324389 [Hypoxylon sp. CI-4A]